MTATRPTETYAEIPHWNEDRYNLWADRYAARNDKGEKIESHPAETWKRVAGAIANTETEQSQFEYLLRNFRFVPGGRILASAGTGSETVAYNCYVIPVEPDAHRTSGRDSRDSIMDTINRMVQIMSRGGGVGINWSTLRPRGSHLVRVNGTSSGSVGWMDVASSAVGEVIQGGSRRGAAMFMLHDWHPDILEFTNVKRDRNKITNANISVAISDKFMQAVKDDAEWTLEFPDTTDPDYNTEWDGDLDAWKESGRKTNVYNTLPAAELWRLISDGAWDNGEPGVVFLERMQKTSTAGSIERIISVNPCGEQPLGAYAVCNLGSLNLNEYVYANDFGDVDFNWTTFKSDVRLAVRFLDNVIDKTHYIADMPQTKEVQERIRRIGLGVMGLADVLAQMGVRYGSNAAVEFTEELFGTMKIQALMESNQLARERGPALGWNRDMAEIDYLLSVQDHSPELWDNIATDGLRNLLVLTQAPTGTTSILAGASSGIEPYFALEYERNDRLGKRMVRPWPYEEWLQASQSLVSLPDYFVTADKLSVEEHIKMQAAAQRHIDSSISKTVNAPNSHTVEDVAHLYMLAYDLGCKGVSYFREGCNRDVVLSRPKEEKPAVVEQPDTASPYVRPSSIFGVTQRKRTKYGNAFVTVNYADDNGPIELFVNVGRASSDVAEWGEGLGRLISLALRHGVDRAVIAEQLTGVGGYGKMAPSLSTAVAEALTEATLGSIPQVEQAPVAMTTNTASICTECGNASMVREEGCMKCQVCGNSRC